MTHGGVMLVYKVEDSRAGQRTQETEHLPYKSEDLTLNPWNPISKLGMVTHSSVILALL